MLGGLVLVSALSGCFLVCTYAKSDYLRLALLLLVVLLCDDPFWICALQYVLYNRQHGPGRCIGQRVWRTQPKGYA